MKFDLKLTVAYHMNFDLDRLLCKNLMTSSASSG